jgi:predicted acyl esterase
VQVDFPDWVDPTGGHNATAVLDRSPYGENKLELIATFVALVSPMHVAVRQDVRGTEKSQGTFGIWHDSPNDGYDTIAWIVSQPWSNNIVYTTGVSADGLASLGMGVNPHPALKAQFVMFAGPTGWQIAYPGGAFRYQLVNNWISNTVPDNSGASITTVIENEAPGPWWDCLNGTQFYQNITWPTMQYGGWYDIFLAPQLAGFHGYQTASAPSARGKQRLFIDVLGHCLGGAGYFPPHTVFGRALAPILLGLDLLQDGNASVTSEGLKAVTFYVMGSTNSSNPAGSYWTTMDEFPAFTPTPYYLTASAGNTGTLSTKVPTASNTTFVYDPSNPVPTLGGNNLFGTCGPMDQRPTEALNRSDVLTFTSAPLTTPLAITGPLDAQLYVSSNCVDTDFTVKLTDVHPDGTSALIQDGIVRMKWRDAPAVITPQLLTPGTVYAVSVSLWNTSFVFDVGHSIRVDVSSSNYPRFSANPNNGLPLSGNGTAVIAHNTVWTGGQYPSAFILPVVDMSQLPPVNLLDATKAMLASTTSPDTYEKVVAHMESLIEVAVDAAHGRKTDSKGLSMW